MKIGVFDSGIGGQSVARAVRIAVEDADVAVYEDKENLPYGSKAPAVLLHLVAPIFRQMIADGCEVIVIACNTVSTTIASQLRELFPTIPMIVMEPMVKPAAAETKNGIIAVCATPTTLASERYDWLKKEYAEGITVLEPDCSDWAYMIEYDNIDGAKIAARINEVIEGGADIIVLACTHYHWIEQEIRVLAQGRARIIQPEQYVVSQLKRVLAQLG